MEKFILTRELGRLARWLRILGFDTVYFKGNNRSSLVITALREDRIIVTRNLRLSAPTGSKLINLKEGPVEEQLKQLLKGLGINVDQSRLFTRCLLCNTALTNIDKEKVKDKVPEYVYQSNEDFSACPDCQKIYWQGTHWGNVLEVLKRIV